MSTSDCFGLFIDWNDFEFWWMVGSFWYFCVDENVVYCGRSFSMDFDCFNLFVFGEVRGCTEVLICDFFFSRNCECFWYFDDDIWCADLLFV